MRRAVRGMSAAVIAGAMAVSAPAWGAPARGETERVSVSASGEQANGDSGGPALSGDGRYAAFASLGSNLVPGDTNGVSDVFVRDRRTGTVERVSVASDGTQADGDTRAVTISGDGRYVVFVSSAGNLVEGDALPPDAQDVYVHDRRTGRTERVSRAADGGSVRTYGDIAVSGDGRYVSFNAPLSRMEDGETSPHLAAYVTDRRTGGTRRISNGAHPEWSVFGVGLSADGRYAAYSQRHPRGGPGELWVHDLRTGGEEQANVTPDGLPSTGDTVGMSLSADGSRIAFASSAGDLGGAVSGTGTETHAYVRDLRRDVTTRILHEGAGRTAFWSAARLSPDGRYLAYAHAVPTAGGDLVDNLYVRDLVTGESRLATEATGGGGVGDDGFSLPSSFSADGRYLAFLSASAQLVPGDTDGHADGFVRRLR
ncbi:TolB family protein [Streptomyces viridosporus]|uniref:TolB family protein n=1 Tax=Streptomyces viridosporus TaxID=67581 RepID=UPI000D1C2C6A|nr:PD40 domain-containing protein [Streptomyces viridosporus]